MPEAVAGVVRVSVGNRPVDERAIRIWDGFCWDIPGVLVLVLGISLLRAQKCRERVKSEVN